MAASTQYKGIWIRDGFVEQGGSDFYLSASSVKVNTEKMIADRLIVNGTSADRIATVSATAQTGQYYFDNDLNVPVWFNGTVWVDATGTTRG